MLRVGILTISDRGSPLPHMLPSPEQFAEQVGALGISDRDDVVVYDDSGTNLSAARVWWMFRMFGHERVAVLEVTGPVPRVMTSAPAQVSFAGACARAVTGAAAAIATRARMRELKFDMVLSVVRISGG